MVLIPVRKLKLRLQPPPSFRLRPHPNLRNKLVPTKRNNLDDRGPLAQVSDEILFHKEGKVYGDRVLVGIYNAR
jgi:hypothetical protein